MPGGLHNALRRSWMGDAVKKALGVHTMGEGGVERFGETLTPVMNLWGMPEWAALRGEQLCAVRTFQAAVAGEFSGTALMNPIGSNTIIVVEAISFTAGAAITHFLEVLVDTLIAATFTVVTNPSCARDRRFKGVSGISRATFRQGTDPANTFGAQLEASANTAAGVNGDFGTCLPVILRPGDDLLCIGQTVNNTEQVNWAWRERQAFPGELA